VAHKQKFFLLTSNEAREAKLIEVQEKAFREESKKAKQEARSNNSKRSCKEKVDSQKVKIRLKLKLVALSEWVA